MTRSAAVRDLLDRGDTARAAGRGEVAARLYDEAVSRCQTEDDLEGWTEAVLGAASVYLFGSEPGKLPAQLYDVLVRTTDDGTRARLAAALARCWAYAGHTSRAKQFAEEALMRAQRVGAAELLADCLDAALAAHWGPDELDFRRSLAGQLDEVAAHVLDPDTRLQAHLWGLQVACETLDLQGIHRQLRALERLGDESARALFFAASRRLMLDLLRGRFDTATHLASLATQAAESAALPDAWMVRKSMDAYSAAFSGEVALCTAAAAECEAFALAEGFAPVCAEAAFLWTCAGRPDRAGALVNTFHDPVLAELPRDVNWLMTLQCVLEAALAAGDRAVIERASHLLEPYEGRAVFNAGAVMFHGLTDDTLSRAAAVLGDRDTFERLRGRALATYARIDAPWWRQRLQAWIPPTTANASHDDDRIHLHPLPGGLWMVGPERDTVQLAELRGFGYLRELLRRPGHPVSALDLVGAGSGVIMQPALDDPLDKAALQAYRRRLGDLEHELAEAQDWSDLGRVDAARAERDALLVELARATGLNGRARTTGSSEERARVAVKKAINAAISRIAAVDEPLGRHLQDTIRTGMRCSYEPAAQADVAWVLD